MQAPPEPGPGPGAERPGPQIHRLCAGCEWLARPRAAPASGTGSGTAAQRYGGTAVLRYTTAGLVLVATGTQVPFAVRARTPGGAGTCSGKCVSRHSAGMHGGSGHAGSSLVLRRPTQRPAAQRLSGQRGQPAGSVRMSARREQLLLAGSWSGATRPQASETGHESGLRRLLLAVGCATTGAALQ